MRPHLPHDRRLHLVDIENLVGCPRPTASQTANCREEYLQRLEMSRGDLVVIACNHGAALGVGIGWPDSRLRVRSGPDGADLALLAVLATESVADRFERVVIASGDGCFADAAALLAAEGIEVTVVSNAQSLSRRLGLAAAHIVLLDAPPPPAVPNLLEAA